MTRIQRSIVYVFANCHTSFRGEKRLQWYSPLFNLLSGFYFSHHQESNQNPSWSQFFRILLVCFSLGGKFIFIDNCFEINETDRILNCGQRYKSKHDPHSWMNNLSSWKRTWKIQVWLSIEPWPLRWPNATLYPLIWANQANIQVLFQLLRLFIQLRGSCSRSYFYPAVQDMIYLVYFNVKFVCSV